MSFNYKSFEVPFWWWLRTGIEMLRAITSKDKGENLQDKVVRSDEWSTWWSTNVSQRKILVKRVTFRKPNGAICDWNNIISTTICYILTSYIILHADFTHDNFAASKERPSYCWLKHRSTILCSYLRQTHVLDLQMPKQWQFVVLVLLGLKTTMWLTISLQ